MVSGPDLTGNLRILISILDNPTIVDQTLPSASCVVYSLHYVCLDFVLSCLRHWSGLAMLYSRVPELDTDTQRFVSIAPQSHVECESTKEPAQIRRACTASVSSGMEKDAVI